MDRLTLWPQLPSISALAPLLLSALAVLYVLKPRAADRSPKALSARASASTSTTAAPQGKFKTWMLLEVFVVSQLLAAQSALLRLLRGAPAGAPVFGFTRSHAVVYSDRDPSFADAVLKRPARVLHNDPAQWDLSVKTFGVAAHLRPRFDLMVPAMFAAVTRALVQEASARPTCAALYARLLERAGRLVQVGGEPGEPGPWAAAAAVAPAGDGAVDADLYTLVRDFTTHLSVDSLCGRGLLADSPQLAADLFAFDDGFALLLLGVPAWLPSATLRAAVAARARLHAAVGRWHGWLDAALAGTVGRDAVPGVSSMFWDRQAVYREHGLVLAERAPLDLALLWAMNANTSPFVFWVLAFVWGTPGLAAALRAEAAEHVRVESRGGVAAAASGLDADAILHRCPRLKAAYLEAFRLAHEPTSVRFVAREFAVPAPHAGLDPAAGPDSPALPSGAVSPRTARALSLSSAPGVVFKAGTFLTVPHAVAQHDARVFSDPERFDPERFLTDTPAGLKAVYGGLRPWGEGAPICKGRVFAEREVLVTVAVLLSLWDVQLLDGVPARVAAAGVMRPVGKCRARIRRRAVEE